VAANASPQQPNTLGKASLILGIASISLVFGLGLCGLVGGAQIPVFVTLLFVCAASSAFLGLVAAILGLGGLFGANRQRAAAIIGLVLGLGGVCLFLVILSAVQGAV
jgi:hypothetical protein